MTRVMPKAECLFLGIFSLKSEQRVSSSSQAEGSVNQNDSSFGRNLQRADFVISSGRRRDSGEPDSFTIYITIPKRRIGWSSGGGGENPCGRSFVLAAVRPAV